MQRSLFTCYVVLLVVLFFSCNDRDGRQPGEKSDGKLNDSVGKTPREKQLYDYAIYRDSFGLPLKAWAHELNIVQHLGQPNTIAVHLLGVGADTHMGAYVKTIKFDGLSILQYAPVNPDTGWIMRMVVTNDQYETARGLKPGDDTSEIKRAYPEARKWPDGRRNQSSSPYYISHEPEQLYLRFYVSSGRIDSIELYHDLP